MRSDRPSWWRRLLQRVGAALDDGLPMSPDEREERDYGDVDSAELAEGRRLRFELRMKEKTGKGGPR